MLCVLSRLGALLASVTRALQASALCKSLSQSIHSDPASDVAASQADQKRRKGASTPATGADTIPLNTTNNQRSADSSQPMSIDGQPLLLSNLLLLQTLQMLCMMFL